MSNVYAELGTCFANSAVTHPRSRRAAGHADQGPRGGSRVLGHGFGLVRLAAVADRGDAPARDPRGHAEEARLRAARRRRWSGEEPIFGGNGVRHYKVERHTNLESDGIGRMKTAYLRDGQDRQPRCLWLHCPEWLTQSSGPGIKERIVQAYARRAQNSNLRSERPSCRAGRASAWEARPTDGVLPSRAEDATDYIYNFFATIDPSHAPGTRSSRQRSVSALMLKSRDLATAAIEIGDVVCDAHQRRADYRPNE